jgi:DNA-binding response OmpR family regulator
MELRMSVILEEFKGKRILVIEDESLLADATRRQLDASRAVVIGPVSTPKQALALIDQHEIDAAILDVMLDAEITLPIADALEARKIPFVFATAFEPDSMPRRYRGFSVSTPEGMQAIAQRLFGERPH